MNENYLPIDLSKESVEYMKKNHDCFNLIKSVEKEKFTIIQNFLIENFIYLFDKKKYKFLHSKIWDIVSDISKVIIITNKINYIKKKNITPIYYKVNNPIFDILFNSVNLEFNDYEFLINKKYKNIFYYLMIIYRVIFLNCFL